MGIEFNNQLVNFKHIIKIQITEKDSKFAVNVIGTFTCEKELFDTEEEAQERYIEIKGKLIKPYLYEICNDYLEEV